MDRRLRAVVDASVAVKLFVPENLSAEAHGIFSRFSFEEDAELIVPDLFFIECANVFWKWVQRHAYPVKDAQVNLQVLKRLGLTMIPTEVVAGESLGIALQHKITAYDACYVAVAAQLEVPLITADRKLATALAKTPFEIQWLGSELLFKGLGIP